MPTTESSNNPHVRITREAHERIRALSVLTGYSQGDLVDELVTERLQAMGNPHLKLKLPPRQRTKAGMPSEISKVIAAKKETTPPARAKRQPPAQEPAPTRRRAAARK